MNSAIRMMMGIGTQRKRKREAPLVERFLQGG